MGKRSDAKKDKLMSLLFEYLKDSNRSDRQIAKVLGVSQPTVSRMKSRLLEEGVVRHFSAIPDFAKMGYEIMAFSFVKFKIPISLTSLSQLLYLASSLRRSRFIILIRKYSL